MQVATVYAEETKDWKFDAEMGARGKVCTMELVFERGGEGRYVLWSSKSRGEEREG